VLCTRTKIQLFEQIGKHIFSMLFALDVLSKDLKQWQMAAFEAMADGSTADDSIGIS
jgi:hypothetical protein